MTARCGSASGSSSRRRNSRRSSASRRSSGCSGRSTIAGRPCPRCWRCWNSRRSAAAMWASCPAGRSNASRWHARWSTSQTCCSSTSRRPASIRSRAASSGRCSMRTAVDGGTIVLTTHYMDEAETLCDRVAIVDHGRVIALGSPRELIASLGAGHVVEFAVDPWRRGRYGAAGRAARCSGRPGGPGGDSPARGRAPRRDSGAACRVGAPGPMPVAVCHPPRDARGCVRGAHRSASPR